MGTKVSLGEPYLGHIASMGEQDVADVLGVERVGEALGARCFPAHGLHRPSAHSSVGHSLRDQALVSAPGHHHQRTMSESSDELPMQSTRLPARAAASVAPGGRTSHATTVLYFLTASAIFVSVVSLLVGLMPWRLFGLAVPGADNGVGPDDDDRAEVRAPAVIKPYHNVDPESNVCRTVACENEGGLLFRQLEFHQEPCDDFYAYVCKRWENNHKLPFGAAKFSVDDALLDEYELLLADQSYVLVREPSLLMGPLRLGLDIEYAYLDDALSGFIMEILDRNQTIQSNVLKMERLLSSSMERQPESGLGLLDELIDLPSQFKDLATRIRLVVAQAFGTDLSKRPLKTASLKYLHALEDGLVRNEYGSFLNYLAFRTFVEIAADNELDMGELMAINFRDFAQKDLDKWVGWRGGMLSTYARLEAPFLKLEIPLPVFDFKKDPDASLERFQLPRIGPRVFYAMYHAVYHFAYNYGAEKRPSRFVSKLHALMDCLGRQYRKLRWKDSRRRIGRSSFYSNLLDFMTLGPSYDSYLRYAEQTKKNDRLPKLENLTPRQLFFVEYARNFCEVNNDTFLDRVLDEGHVSPAWYRVNGPLRNFRPFADAFLCKPNTFMNPVHRCTL
ncbi:hypothetical protein HPB47_027133 [Ixodes persulcatus]|uniref:Uncharacterized protein n=1 Tax=Ixodes persulcatus TaxID=34615 RepID=A0AC60PXX4_IXOPE|nr:hypothetical protein HPB47_027133 [Ixodes persulcatus]